MPDPTFNSSTAVAVAPWRHAPTARTVAWHQPGATGFTDLFSATRLFIATATDEEAEANEVPAPAPVASLPEEAGAIFRPIFDGLTGGAGTLSSLSASAADLGRIVEGVVSGERRAYRVTAGTDAQALPGIVRPVNYHATLNAVLFVAV
jgi:hypothetical protein